MAEQEQVKRLKRSIEEWNHWRAEQRSGFRPDLSRANFSQNNLSAADLHSANLRTANLATANLCTTTLTSANLIETNLSHANLTRAHLARTNLAHTNLSYANLTAANLIHANLTNANLINADLSGADLTGANLSGSDLSGAHMTSTILAKATFSSTIFAWINLSNVFGLETAIHVGPSIADLNSVTFPHHEQTRTSFLLGVGFTKMQIEHILALLTRKPLTSLFIIYAHQDKAIAQQLSTDLRQNHLPCWFKPYGLQTNNASRERLEQAIHTQDKILLLLSKHTLKSAWVRHEVELTLAREKREERQILFPIRLDDALFLSTASWATSLQSTHPISDFTNIQDSAAYQQAFSMLLQLLKVSSPSGVT